jgi:hypothetical protein
MVRLHLGKHLGRYEYMKTGEIIVARNIREVGKRLGISQKNCMNYVNYLGRVEYEEKRTGPMK